jgi:hypothetical protein
MSNFYGQSVVRKARKAHRCSYCGQAIERGERYHHQTGTWDGGWFDSKFHDECIADLSENGDGEFTPYSNDRPQVEGGAA